MSEDRIHLDLFSGVGGFALAASWASYTTIGFCEIDPFCRRVLAKHWPETPIHDDIHTLSGETIWRWAKRSASGVAANAASDLRRPSGDDRYVSPNGSGHRLDLLTGGFPCQGFSLAGKRLGQEDDRYLWPEMFRLIGELRPRAVLAENVPGIISLALDDVLSDLEGLGYSCRAVVVPACAINAPHRRDRAWIVAHAADGGIRRGSASGNAGLTARGGEITADAKQQGSQGMSWRGDFGARGASVEPTRGRFGKALSGVGESHDGIPGRMAGCGVTDPRWRGDPFAAFGDDWEDGVPRTTDHEPMRAAKLKALGNSIVPQVAFALLQMIRQEV